MRATGQGSGTCGLLIGVLGVALLLVPVLACGSDAEPGLQEEREFQKVTVSDQVFTFDDFAVIGFREQKEYDPEGLTAATGAWFGWWRSGSDDPIDYEVRFYASHADAVEYGTPFAEEASGDDAILLKDNPTWMEDVVERRAVMGGARGTDGGVAAGGIRPRYADYLIFANMVLLCEGSTSDHSLERCKALVEALVGAAEE